MSVHASDPLTRDDGWWPARSASGSSLDVVARHVQVSAQREVPDDPLAVEVVPAGATPRPGRRVAATARRGSAVPTGARGDAGIRRAMPAGARRGRPPIRRRVTGAPRVVAPAACAVRRPSLPVTWLVAAAAMMCLAVVGVGLLAGAQATPEQTTVVRVEPGESLWQIAERVAPNSEPAVVVEQIRDLNGGLEGALMPGQPLTVPAG